MVKTGEIEAKAAGCTFYELPSRLTAEQIDPLLRRCVFRINESGWVWTAESCQGHPDSPDRYVWAGNTRPMLRLVTRARDFGPMMKALFDSAFYIDDLIPGSLGFEIYPYNNGRPEWCEILVYIAQVSTAFHRNQGIAAFERFAENLCAADIEVNR